MPQPTFSINKPPRLKRTKSAGGIVKNVSNRKNAVVNDSAETTGSNAVSESVVATRVRQIESSILSNKLPDGHSELKNSLVNSIKVLEKLVKELSAFSIKELITRRDIVSLTDIISIYTELGDIEVKIVRDFKKYVSLLKLSEEQIEASQDCVKPSTVDSILESSAKAIGDALNKFKRIKREFPDSPQVITCLDFVDVALPPRQGSDSGSSKTKGSDSSIGGIDSLRAKINKTENEFDKKLKEVESKIGDKNVKKDLAFHQSICRQLEKIEVRSNTALDKLSDRLERTADVTESDLNSFDNWVSNFQSKLEIILEDSKRAIDKFKEVQSVKKSDYSTFFKKQDPPRFKGDCLDYIEWKKQWLSQVSSHSPPSEFEIDLLKRHLPEEGKKKLYGCDSITTAWHLLDKMFGDKKLIVQKLKSKLRNLKPKSTEAHEIVIEVADEVEYLVKRLRLLGATDVLTIDNDFLNSIYKHLPEFHRQKWDDFDYSEYPSEWSAFMEFCNDIYTKAISKRTRMESIKEMDKNSKISSVQHSKICAVNSSGNKASAHNSNSPVEMDEKYRAKADKYGECKVCNERHTFTNKFTKRTQPSDKFLNCESFKSLNKAERGKIIERYKACRRCLSWSHDASSCTMKVIQCKEKINGSDCNKDHSKLICGSGIVYCLCVRSGNDKIDESVPSFPQMDDAVVSNGTARIVYDGGSQ